MSLSCSQMSSLMTFYINNRLEYPLKQMFEQHLENCPSCREKYNTLLKIMDNFSKAKEIIDNMDFAQYSEFEEELEKENEKDYVLVQNLSAYSDNELSADESLKVKKYIISNSSARKTLEEFYALKKLLNNSFEKSSNKFKEDYSKCIMKQLDLKEECHKGGSRLKVASIFIFLMTSLTLGLIYVVSSMLI